MLIQPGNKKNTRLPDFLLVGAAKSATSSLYFYLDQHPQIAMASQKESWFFSYYKNPPDYASPGVLSDVVSELDTYLRLYDGAETNQILGDACPSYLYTYEDTIRNIRQLYSNEALEKLKIIISLREPVSRAYSQFYTFKRKVQEPLAFDQAIQQGTINQRLREKWNIFYDYIGFGMYAKQVEAFQQAFGKERVHVLLYEDIHTDIQKTCRGIYDFLGVDPEIIVDDRHKYNAISGEPKLKWVVAGMFSKNRFKRKISALIPERLRMRIIFIIFKILLKREAMGVNTRRQVAEYFREDIVKLEKLIGRDLSGWQN
ncbi:MAG: sulfotransferase [Gammaproteobacteria bacterium]|nr:sulfotransferase [Gammaproteobacteria bacterium]